MSFLVICKDKTAFYTDWYTKENCWNPDTILCVINGDKITFDGENWHDIEYDHL